MNTGYYDLMDSPAGRILMACDDRGLRAISFGDKVAAPPRWSRDPGKLFSVREQLTQYFAGERRQFSLHVEPGGTPFQQQVWTALMQIPYGQVISYGELARRVGNPSASRAVGGANARNPIPIVIPCHRVINANGALGGYSSGPTIKRQLLALEGHLTEQSGLVF